MINNRLSRGSVDNLIELSHTEGFPFPISRDDAKRFCGGVVPKDTGVLTYGAYYMGTKLVSVATASYMLIFPHKNSPTGRAVQISGVYTLPEFRHAGYATGLIFAIIRDAKESYKADYICCDSTTDKLYLGCGFIKDPENKNRLWRPLIN